MKVPTLIFRSCLLGAMRTPVTVLRAADYDDYINTIPFQHLTRTNLKLGNVLGVDPLRNGERQDGLNEHNYACFQAYMILKFLNHIEKRLLTRERHVIKVEKSSNGQQLTSSSSGAGDPERDGARDSPATDSIDC